MNSMLKNRIRFFYFLIIIFLSVFNLPLLSYGAESNRLGIVDLQRVMQESVKGKQAFELFGKEFKEKREKLESEEKEIEKLKKDILEGLPNWSDEVKESKQEEFNKRLKEYQVEKEEFEEQVKKKNFELNKKIVNEIMDVIENVAKKENYTIILETGSVLYFSPNLDITQKIIEKYNAKAK